MTDTIPTAPDTTAKGAQDWLTAIGVATPSLVEQPTAPVAAQVTAPPAPQVTVPTPVVPQVTTPPAPQPFYQFSQADRESILNSIPPDQRAAYEKSLPLVADVAQRMVEHAINTGIAPKLTRYEESMQAHAEQQDAMFEAALQQRIGNVDALLQDPNFAAYLDAPIPYSGGVTPRQALLKSYDGRNIDGVLDVVNGFKSRQAAQAPTPPTPVMHQASQYANPLPAKVSPAGQILPASTINRAMVDFSAGRITREVYNELLKQFEVYSRDGRIDHSR